MDYVATFLEGLATFVSPCLLPMLPLYLAYFAGDAVSASGAGEGAGKGRMLASVAGFVIGFAAVFVALGAFAGAIGGALSRYSLVVSVVCGMVVIVFGLHFAGALRIPLLDTTIRGSNALTNAQIKRIDMMTVKFNKAIEDYRCLVDELIRRGVL